MNDYTVENARRILETLRRGPDQIHIEPVSEDQTWLASYVFYYEGKRQAGITDCCFVASQCRYHEAIYEDRCPSPWVPSLELVQHWTGVRASFSAPITSPEEKKEA